MLLFLFIDMAYTIKFYYSTNQRPNAFSDTLKIIEAIKTNLNIYVSIKDLVQ